MDTNYKTITLISNVSFMKYLSKSTFKLPQFSHPIWETFEGTPEKYLFWGDIKLVSKR